MKFFDKNRSTKDGFQFYCKACRKALPRGHKPCVYYLPEEHYIGVTSHLINRMSGHRQRNYCTEGYEILAYFEREEDAMFLEIQFHQRGYNGYRKL